MNPGALRLLFDALKDVGYDWQAQTPDRLLSFRKDASSFRPLVQWLGLGVPVARDALIDDGLTSALLQKLETEKFTIEVNQNGTLFMRAAVAVSSAEQLFIVHDHWPPDQRVEGGYIHYGPESSWLSRELSRDLEEFTGRKVMDLGCSSGALALGLAGVARQIVGLDISARAISWGRTIAEAYGFERVRFGCAEIGQSSAEAEAGQELWDVAVMNPPMMIPIPHMANPHRDGGELGIKLPLLFLSFAQRHLRSGGEMYCLATNPIVHGRGEFFEKFNASALGWEPLEQRRIHTHFNQAAARKHGYAEQGIERVELWYLRLQKR
jgi:SAM-dependent methyltransferase